MGALNLKIVFTVLFNHKYVLVDSMGFLEKIQKQQSCCATQCGNVLFIILIAVALFAALSFAVSDMMRGADPNSIRREKAPLLADGIIDYARTLRQGVQDIRINGCSSAEVSFENSIVAGYEHAPVARDACKLFHGRGGGVNYARPPDSWLDITLSSPTLQREWFFPANVCIPEIGSAPAGTGCNGDSEDNESLIVILPYILQDVCAAINDRLGLGAAPLTEVGDAWPSANTRFTGTQTDGTVLNQDRRMAGCFQGTGTGTPPTGTYHFFQVLVAR